MIRRTTLGWMVAPAIAVFTFWCLAYAFQALRPEQLPDGAAGHTLFFFMFFGLPIAYLITFVAAVPTYIYFRDRNRLTPRNVLIAAASIGAFTAATLVVAEGIRSPADVRFLFGAALVGATAGLAGGTSFVLIGSSSSARRSAS